MSFQWVLRELIANHDGLILRGIFSIPDDSFAFGEIEVLRDAVELAYLDLRIDSVES